VSADSEALKPVALAGTFEKVGGLVSYPSEKNSKLRVLPESTHLAIVASKLVFIQQSMNLSVADSMQPNRLHATLRLWDEMMGIALCIRDDALAKRAYERFFLPCVRAV
jgi:hypothetical protein